MKSKRVSSKTHAIATCVICVLIVGFFGACAYQTESKDGYHEKYKALEGLTEFPVFFGAAQAVPCDEMLGDLLRSLGYEGEIKTPECLGEKSITNLSGLDIVGPQDASVLLDVFSQACEASVVCEKKTCEAMMLNSCEQDRGVEKAQEDMAPVEKAEYNGRFQALGPIKCPVVLDLHGEMDCKGTISFIIKSLGYGGTIIFVDSPDNKLFVSSASITLEEPSRLDHLFEDIEAVCGVRIDCTPERCKITSEE